MIHSPELSPYILAFNRYLPRGMKLRCVPIKRFQPNQVEAEKKPSLEEETPA